MTDECRRMSTVRMSTMRQTHWKRRRYDERCAQMRPDRNAGRHVHSHAHSTSTRSRRLRYCDNRVRGRDSSAQTQSSLTNAHRHDDAECRTEPNGSTQVTGGDDDADDLDFCAVCKKSDWCNEYNLDAKTGLPDRVMVHCSKWPPSPPPRAVVHNRNTHRTAPHRTAPHRMLMPCDTMHRCDKFTHLMCTSTSRRRVGLRREAEAALKARADWFCAACTDAQA